MKKFRLSYDRLFNAWPPFTHNERIVDGAGMFLTFRFFKDNNEVLFEEGYDAPVTDKVICSVDKENGVLLKIKPFKEAPWFDCFTCTVTGYYLVVYSSILEVSREEFLEVIQNYWDNFDNSDNYEAQFTCIAHVEVK